MVRGPSSMSSLARVGALVWMAAGALGCGAGEGEPLGATGGGVCAYPEARYGYEAGDVSPPTLSWQGSAEQGRALGVSLADYFDCDGSRGINAILVDQSAAWCGPCQRL